MNPALPFTISGPHIGQAAQCEPILRLLPDWFGIEEAIQKYVLEIDRLPTFLASNAQGTVGFLTVKQHNPFSAELLVMAVRPEAQRCGIGRALVRRAEAWLRERRVEYLQVKTLAASNPDIAYAKTRAFYLSVGFRPLEDFSQIWNADNPCLILVKRL